MREPYRKSDCLEGREMYLPEGKTCNDCTHFARPCKTIYGRIELDEVCDWWPIKFVEIKK